MSLAPGTKKVEKSWTKNVHHPTSPQRPPKCLLSFQPKNNSNHLQKSPSWSLLLLLLQLLYLVHSRFTPASLKAARVVFHHSGRTPENNMNISTQNCHQPHTHFPENDFIVRNSLKKDLESSKSLYGCLEMAIEVRPFDAELLTVLVNKAVQLDLDANFHRFLVSGCDSVELFGQLSDRGNPKLSPRSAKNTKI